MLNNDSNQHGVGEVADVPVRDVDRSAPTGNADSRERDAASNIADPHERSIAEAFGYEVPRRYPHDALETEDVHGQFFGHGTKDYRRSDDQIRQDVSHRLMTHPDITASEVEIQVSGGIVTLIGTVEDRHEKRLAEYIAEDAVGVDDVDNRLKIRHGFWAGLTGERAVEPERRKD